jgi:hypothetical protein
MARDRLTEVDVCPYVAGDDGAASSSAAAAQSTECRAVELESLDLLNLAFSYCWRHRKRPRRFWLARSAKWNRFTPTRWFKAWRWAAKRPGKTCAGAAAFASAGQTLLAFEARMIERYTPQLVRLALEIAENYRQIRCQ